MAGSLMCFMRSLYHVYPFLDGGCGKRPCTVRFKAPQICVAVLGAAQLRQLPEALIFADFADLFFWWSLPRPLDLSRRALRPPVAAALGAAGYLVSAASKAPRTPKPRAVTKEERKRNGSLRLRV